MKRIQLISSPRNISTALMYSFASRSDCRVVDEPYYAYYLSKSGKKHPGREEILASQNQDPSAVLESLLVDEKNKPLLFVKNMSKHFYGLGYAYLKDFDNVILIRNPYQLIISYAKVVPNPEMEDIGAKRQFHIYKSLLANGRDPIVIDSGEVLKDPLGVLSALCERLQIPFEKSMLQWEKGARKEDGVWAKIWYKNVHNSTGFIAQSTSNGTLNPALNDLYEEAREYYELLFKKAIKAKHAPKV